ncbi:MAG: hypothetical protein LBT94_00765 [Prevotellaceae bacterium]|nr:hypothetical protein [Prevotellaceae bacterium]
MMTSQPQRSCLQCRLHSKRERACRDVHALLCRLKIPPQEQAILWRMASKKVGCSSFKNILSSLQSKLPNHQL